VTIPRTIDPAAAGPLQETAVAASGGARLMRLTRRSDEELLYHDERRAGARALTIRSLAGGMLAQAYEIGPGSGDNRYLVTEEITGVKPALQVRVFVQRFDRTGKLTGVIHVPLDGMEAVPPISSRLPAKASRACCADGQRRQDQRNRVRAAAKGGAAAQRRGRQKLWPAIAASVREHQDRWRYREPFRFKETAVLKFELATPAVKRDTVLANARAYLTVNWVMQQANYVQPGIDNACEPRTDDTGCGLVASPRL